MSEKDEMFSPRVKKLGRIPGKEQTMPKTYSFFSSDINTALNNGWSPKEVFRLGIKAKENNPEMINRIRELEELNRKLSDKFQKVVKRLYDLEGKVDI